jgi:phospholipase/carboxylesterase
MRRIQLGPLDATLVGPTTGDAPVIVLCHGFGASGDDLVSLAEAFELDPAVRWVFPAAPLAIDGLGDGRAWWMIDFDRLERGLVRDDELPDGLPAARAALTGLLDAVRTELGVADERVVLGGFSQGAMLSLDVALHDGRPLAALILLSGTLLARGEWEPRLGSRAGLAVFQSHGTRDSLLPYRSAETLRDLMAGAGMRVAWLPFDGGHEIPPPLLEEIAGFVTAADRPPGSR